MPPPIRMVGPSGETIDPALVDVEGASVGDVLKVLAGPVAGFGAPVAGYSDEQAQDAIGTILVDSATVDFTYTDATPAITATVIDDSITFAKMQNIATDRVLGRDTASSGDIEELTIGTGLAIQGGALVATGGVGESDVFAPAGPKTPIVIGDFAWINQGGAAYAVSARDGSLTLACPANASSSFRGLMKDTPSTPYTVIAHIEDSLPQVNNRGYGLFWRQDASNLHIALQVVCIASNYGVFITLGNVNYTFEVSNYITPGFHKPPSFFALRDDGTDRKYYIGTNEEEMLEVYSHARTTGCTPDKIGFFANPRHATWRSLCTLFSWHEQSAAPHTL